MTAYIYALRDPITHQMRYVGKTTNPKRRWYDHIHLRATDHSYRANWIRSLLAAGNSPKMMLLETLADHDDWELREQRWIKTLRAYHLPMTNLAIGGQGNRAGSRLSPETVEKVRRKLIGRPVSQDTRQKLSLARKRNGNTRPGYRHSIETKHKLSEARKRQRPPTLGNTHSLETKARMKKAWELRRLRQQALLTT